MTDSMDEDMAVGSSAPQLDEDRLGMDPLEEGMDPPEHWKQADKFGNTPAEQRRGQDLEHRLLEEEPDVLPDRLDEDRTIADTPDNELDETIDEQTFDDEPVAPEEPTGAVLSPAARRGQSADEAGGSVAEEIRTPPQ